MSGKPIEFLRFVHLRGPNLWTYRPVIEAWVDIGDLEDCPSDSIPGFPERLAALLPGLVDHRCSYGERGGFLRRLVEGTWPAHILEHVTVELQNLAGMPGGFGRARSTSPRGVYKVDGARLARGRHPRRPPARPGPADVGHRPRDPRARRGRRCRRDPARDGR